MLPTFLPPDPSISAPRFDFQIFASLRTRRAVRPAGVVHAALVVLSEQSDPLLQVDRYHYTAVNSDSGGVVPFKQSAEARLVRALRDESRIEMTFVKYDKQNDVETLQIKIEINSSGHGHSINRRGRRVYVPDPGDNSAIFVRAAADHFLKDDFADAYLALASRLFAAINGEVGFAEHDRVTTDRIRNDYDRIHSSFFDPWFITWANFFGPDLVARFGRDKLQTTPGFRVLETPHRGLLLVMNKNPLEENLPEAQALIAAAKEYLGILSPTERAGADKVAEFNREFAEREAEMGRGIGKAFRTIQEELPGEMARISAGCVEGVKKFWGVTLDYTPSSLGAVEKVLLDISGDTDEDVIASAVQAFGAYFGEVVRRHWGGVWHAEDLKGTYVLNDVGPAPIRVAPFEVVREFIRSGGAQVSLGSWFESQGKRNA